MLTCSCIHAVIWHCTAVGIKLIELSGACDSCFVEVGDCKVHRIKVGAAGGTIVGALESLELGDLLGSNDGCSDGLCDGDADGIEVGPPDSLVVGAID